MCNDNDSDSGCSTTDEELCDITNKMVADPIAKPHKSCNHKASPSSASSGCACLFPDDSEHSIMFDMEANQESELDIDMIENN